MTRVRVTSGVTRHVTAPALHNSVTAHCRLMRMTGWLQVIMRLSVEGLVFTLRHDNITLWDLLVSRLASHFLNIDIYQHSHTHDFIRQMQGLKIFKGSIITSAITTRAGSNTTSSPPAFLWNYSLQTNRFPWNANGLTNILLPYPQWWPYLFYIICIILLLWSLN